MLAFLEFWSSSGSVVIIIDRSGFGDLCKFGNRDLSVCAKASVLEDFHELRAQGSVKKGDATTNLAHERMI